MDGTLSVLSAFPPATPFSSDLEYDEAIRQHGAKVHDLVNKTQSTTGVQLLEVRPA